VTSIVKNRSGKYVYLYESTSYRDQNGKPKSTRKCVGRIDPKTGQEHYHADYLERVWGTDKQPVIGERTTFSLADARSSFVKDYGVYYLLSNIANSIGLTEIIQSVFPNFWEKILSLSYYMAVSGDPMMYCEYWIDDNESIVDSEALTSQNIAKLLLSITENERTKFYEKWVSFRTEQEVLALDITSVSSYSELIEDVDWGYNRDGDKLPQINICMIVGEESKLPVFQMVYNGALKDVSTLKTTLSMMSGINLSKLSIVMDKGFASKKNIEALLSVKDRTRFLISLPFTMKFCSEIVDEARKSIDTIDNTILIGNDILRGIKKKVFWDSFRKVNAYVFYNPMKYYTNREELFAKVKNLKDETLDCVDCRADSTNLDKYLIVKRSANDIACKNVLIRNNVIENELKHKGFMVAISNYNIPPAEVISKYRAKDVVEKAFLKLKNSFDLGRIRIHSNNAM
jgi:transposase